MRTVAVKLTAEAQGYLATIGKATLATQQFASRSSAAIAKHDQAINKLSNTAGLVGAGMLAGVGFVVKSAAQFDKAMSAVAATGNDARLNMDGLRKAAIDMGASTVFSATEAAKGIENLLKAGVSATDVMGGGLKGALDLAAAGNMEVGEAAEIAAMAMTQFNLTGRQVPHIADLLAAGAGKAQGEVHDMGMALKQSGLVASQFGLSIEDTTGTLAAFAGAGLLGSDAGTSFKTMLLALAAPSGKAADEMERLGIAAYDSQGNFVGITGLAEQLRTKMIGLTEAERNKAMATIFGNDAIRAANVLYKQGGAGIQTWIDKTNDAGYAAKVARERLNNLSGDVEQLRGAFESAFITAGTGPNEALRGLTQSATRAVRAFGNLPAPVLEAGVKVAAFTGIGLLAVSGLGRLATSGVEVVGMLRDISAASPKAGRALAVVGKAGAAAAAAFVAAQVAGTVAKTIKGEFVPSVDDAAGALLRLGMAKQAGNVGDLDKFFAISNDTINNIDGVGEALSRATNPIWSDRLGSIVDKFAGTEETLTKTKLNIEAVDSALSSLSGDQAADAFRRMAMEAQAAGTPVEELVNLFPKYRDSVKAVANASGQNITSQKQMADVMMNGVAPASIEAAQGLAKTANKAGGVSAESRAAKKQLEEMTEAMFASADAAIQLEGSEDGVEAAIDAVTKSAKENGRTLDKHTEKGRNNREALRNLALANKAYVSRLVETGASTKKVDRATDNARTAFIKSAEKMGLSSRRAKDLADKYGLVDRKINALNNKTVKTKVTFSVSGSGFKLHIPDSLRVVKEMASGGLVRGPGTGTSDSILGMDQGGIPTAKVSNGEYVINAASTRKYRPLIDDINADRLATGGIVHPKISSNRFPDPGYTGARLRDLGAKGISRVVGDAVGKAMEAQALSSPTGSVGAYSAGMAGTIARLRAAGARSFTTYPGHHPSMAKARDVTPHNWKIANTARASKSVWYVIYSMRIASKNHGNTWRQYHPSSRRGDWTHRSHVHVAWYDKGGILKPGLTLAYNGTGRNERVTPAGGERPVSDYRFANGGGSPITHVSGGDVTVVLNAPNYVGSHAELKQTFVTMFRRGDLDSILKR